MPRNADEDSKMLYAISQRATIDWDEVSKMTGISKCAVTQRFGRWKKAMEAQNDINTMEPGLTAKKCGRKRKIEHLAAKDARPKEKKVKAATEADADVKLPEEAEEVGTDEIERTKEEV